MTERAEVGAETDAPPVLFSGDTFLIEVEWDVPGLPSRIGPFMTQTEAEDWGALNIPKGTWNVAPLAWPYYRSGGRRG